MAAGRAPTEPSHRALGDLCESYWYPLYAYLRRQGFTRLDAEDLTQSYFAFLLARNGLHGLHPDKGRFRSFLLASLKHFVANERDKKQAIKRGGRVSFVSIDDAQEQRFQDAVECAPTPDKAFERTWALTLIQGVLARLREEYAKVSKENLYDALAVYLTEESSKKPYAETARELSLGEGAVRMAVLRMRRRFGEALRATVAHTVSRPEDIDSEIRALLAAMAD